MKLFGWRKYYCKSAWNLLDSVIIAVGIIGDTIIHQNCTYVHEELGCVLMKNRIRFSRYFSFQNSARICDCGDN